MQLRVKPSAWITTSGLSPAWTLSTARNRISSSVLWSRARASRRFMPHYSLCLLTYALVNTGVTVGLADPRNARAAEHNDGLRSLQVRQRRGSAGFEWVRVAVPC